MSRPQLIIEASPEAEVLDHWMEQSGCRPRSAAVIQAYLKRIRDRLKDGYSVEELKRAVDVACSDPFYLAQGYNRVPEVIFRNVARIDTLLLKWESMAEREAPTPKPVVEDELAWVNARGGLQAVRAEADASGLSRAAWCQREGAPLLTVALLGHARASA